MQLIYIANARIPSEKAHPYQILQMCEAFAAQETTLTLWYAKRSNPHPAAPDFWSHYGIQQTFKTRRLTCIDLFPLANRFPSALRRVANRVAALVQLVTFNLSVIAALSRTPPDTVIYSRDPITLWLIAKLRPQLAPCCFFEAHTYPETGIGLHIRHALARRIGGFVVITRHLAQRYADLGVSPVRLLTEHDGVNLNRFADVPDSHQAREKAGWPIDAFIVGYLGRLVGGLQDMDKGLDTLIFAALALKNQYPDKDIRLALVGGPDSFIPKLLKKHQPSTGFLLTPGQVPPSDVPHYLSMFDVCTIPSPWNDFFAYYTSPLKLFEYMAAWRPIVATALPSTEEVLSDQENALLVTPSDASSLQVALEQLLLSSELGQTLAKQAFTDVQYYTWKNRAKRILAWINDHMTQKAGL